jgi:hypothetical protein
MDESGVMHKIKKNWLDARNAVIGISEAETLGYVNLAYLFAVLCAGVLVAMLLALCEFLRHRCSFSTKAR